MGVVLYTLRWRGEGEVVRDRVWDLFNDRLSWIRTCVLLITKNPVLYHWTTKASVEEKKLSII